MLPLTLVLRLVLWLGLGLGLEQALRLKHKGEGFWLERLGTIEQVEWEDLARQTNWHVVSQCHVAGVHRNVREVLIART